MEKGYIKEADIMVFPENYGLEFLKEDDMVLGLAAYTAKNGKPVVGYYGTPYFFQPMGNMEFWISTERNETGGLSVAEIHSHCCGRCVWDLVHSGIDITPRDGSKRERIILFHRADGESGLIPVNLINADVLPSFCKGDKFRAQVIAIPLIINYYADEDEYENAQPENENGEKWMDANGALLPMRFLYNHNPEHYDSSKDYISDSHVQFNATVTGLYYGAFEFADTRDNTFIRCFADTSFGELEFVHSYEQVPEEQRKNIKVGSVISGVCVISGDVAIEKYENGIIKDFDHDLRLLRYSFDKGDTERLRSVLAETAVYETDTSGKSFIGPDEIVNKIQYVKENTDDTENQYFAHLATITENGGAEYPVGTRCIVLASGSETNYESVAFITVDENGMITHIKISMDKKYHFKIDD